MGELLLFHQARPCLRLFALARTLELCEEGRMLIYGERCLFLIHSWHVMLRSLQTQTPRAQASWQSNISQQWQRCEAEGTGTEQNVMKFRLEIALVLLWVIALWLMCTWQKGPHHQWVIARVVTGSHWWLHYVWGIIKKGSSSLERGNAAHANYYFFFFLGF